MTITIIHPHPYPTHHIHRNTIKQHIGLEAPESPTTTMDCIGLVQVYTLRIRTVTGILLLMSFLFLSKQYY